jgi:Ni,Fe-hydrogenase III small subunit
MVNFNEDEVFLDAVDHVVLVALEIIGRDPAPRFALFKGLVAAAQDATAEYVREIPHPLQ